MGTNIANELNVIAVPVSAVATAGFPNPAVFTDDANLVVVVRPCIAAALPVPAIIASTVVIIGLKSTKVDDIATNPAIAANGAAMVSSILSTNGI